MATLGRCHGAAHHQRQIPASGVSDARADLATGVLEARPLGAEQQRPLQTQAHRLCNAPAHGVVHDFMERCTTSIVLTQQDAYHLLLLTIQPLR